MILEILWLACYNPGIDWRTEEVKIMKYLKECGKQWRLKQGKSEWQKQKKEERKEEAEKKQKEREKTKERKKDRSKESNRRMRDLR